jgi:hypothetical protein
MGHDDKVARPRLGAPCLFPLHAREFSGHVFTYFVPSAPRPCSSSCRYFLYSLSRSSLFPHKTELINGSSNWPKRTTVSSNLMRRATTSSPRPNVTGPLLSTLPHSTKSEDAARAGELYFGFPFPLRLELIRRTGSLILLG